MKYLEDVMWGCEVVWCWVWGWGFWRYPLVAGWVRHYRWIARIGFLEIRRRDL
jgi:hypothetical protein